MAAPHRRERRRPPGTVRPLLAGILAFVAALTVAADDVRTVRVSRSGSSVVVSLSAADLFDAEAESELESGLPTRVSLRVALSEEGDSTPVAASVRTCESTYDLWDEVFHVEVTDERGTVRVDTSERRDAIRLCTVLRNHRIHAPGLPAGRYVVDVVAELNPASDEVLSGLQGWLRVSASSGVFGEQGQSLFGSFVAIFLNTPIGDADRTLRFRSTPVDL